MICQKRRSFPWEQASFKEILWIHISQWQDEAGRKGAQQRNRQPCPDRPPVWITEIRALDAYLPASSATELFIHVEKGFFFCTILLWFQKYILFLTQLSSYIGWRFASIWMSIGIPIQHHPCNQAFLSQNQVSGKKLKQNQGMIAVTKSVHIQIAQECLLWNTDFPR